MKTQEAIRSNFTAEMTGTLLFHQHAELSRIIIERLGGNMRGRSKDVNAVRKCEYLHDIQEYIVIESYRQSIYKTLPESYFHPPTLGGVGRPDEEIIDEIRKQRMNENEALQFFKPFEQEQGYLQIHALLDELAFDKKASNDDMLHLFEQGWPIISHLPYRCALAYVYLLPLMHQMRGTKQWAEKCFSFITGFPVSIIDNYRHVSIEKSSSSFALNESVLGVNSCINGTLNDGLYEWKVLVGPISHRAITDVMPSSGFKNLMNHLIENFTPIQLFTQWEIITEKENDTTLMPSGNNNAYLGYSFYL